jgi:two-component system CheB/CheR fusion protein
MVTIMESDRARGVSMTINPPKAEAGQTGAAQDAADGGLKKGGGEVVLLVEDEVDVREVTTKLMETLGYTVLAARDGAAALEIARNTDRIDLVLSDIVLPGGMNGFEICRRLCEQKPGLKCLFMSGYASLPGQQLPEGTEILRKPVAMAVLAASLRQALDA